MSHHRPTEATRQTRRRTRRAGLVASAVAAVLLPLGLAAPAVAADAPNDRQAAAATAQQDVPTVVDHVSDFYGGYIAALGEGNNSEAQALRAENLSADFQKRLAAWEAENQADGVLRAQSVPVDVDVVYDGSGMGHSWTIVTLHYEAAEHELTQLHVQSDINTQQITDIKPFTG